jgi:hypothetical protein
MDMSFLSWNKFDEIQQYISNLLDIKCKWNPIEGTAIDTNEFIYNSDTYHIFISCRKNDSFGFGISNKESMESVINETISYDGYKQYILEKLHPIFNFN